jgi:hypothetical protein
VDALAIVITTGSKSYCSLKKEILSLKAYSRTIYKDNNSRQTIYTKNPINQKLIAENEKLKLILL